MGVMDVVVTVEIFVFLLWVKLRLLNLTAIMEYSGDLIAQESSPEHNGNEGQRKII